MPGAKKIATSTATVSPATVSAGGSGVIKVVIKVASGFHINSATPNDPDLIGTTVTPASVSGLKFGKAVYPAARTITAPSLSQKPLAVYVGNVTVNLPVKVAKSAKPGKYKTSIAVYYQGCNSDACFPPTTDTVVVSVPVK
jgi:hypothetical protein